MMMPLLDGMHHVVGMVANDLPTLADAVIRASVVLACAALVTSLMGRTSAAARHLTWVSAILVALAVPMLGNITPRWEARVLPAETLTVARDFELVAADPGLRVVGTAYQARQRTATLASSAPPTQTAATSNPNRPSAAQHEQAAAASASWALGDWVALIWMAGVLMVLARLAFGTFIVWSAARRAERVDDAGWLMLVQRTARELGISRPVTLLASACQIVPITWGVVYPIVLLPESALQWEPARRDAVLVHELAHVGRFDALTQTVVQLAVALLWFNPLVWMAAKRVRTERERACDDLVLAHGTRASVYADDLLTMVRMLTRSTEPAFAALAMARRSEFEGRMLAILDPHTDRSRLGRRGATIAAIVSIAIALPLAALRPLPRVMPTAAVASHDTTTAGNTVSQRRSPGPLTALRSGMDAMQGVLTGASARMMAIATDGATCTNRSGHHVSIHSDDSGSTYVISDDKHCLVVRSKGKIAFSDDDTRIKSISSGGHISITEWVGNDERQYDARPSGSGLEESYRVNDKRVAGGVDRAWLATVIPQIVRQDGALAPARAARIRRQRGVAGLLAEVHAISGDYAKRAYLDALLDQGGMTSDSLHLITAFGTKELSSDYDKAEFLSHVSRLARDASTSGAIATAARSVSSDYYKHQLLSAALTGSGDRDVLSRQVIAASNDISSDYDREAILLDVLSRGRLSDAALTGLLGSASGVSGDYYRAVVLDSVAKSQPLSSRGVYTALLQSADGVTGSYYRAGVLKSILARQDLTPDLAAATITSARTLSADNDKADVLAAVAATPTIRNAAVREAYFATAKTIESSSDYRRAMSAVLP